MKRPIAGLSLLLSFFHDHARRARLYAGVLAALAASASAQNVINGTNGRDFLQGTGGNDDVSNSAMNGASDGVRDTIDVSGDPQNIDWVEMGPEDCLKCDPNDLIFIVNGAGGLLWHGTGEQWMQLQAFGLWVRSLIRQAIAAFPQFTFVQAMPLVFAALGLDIEDPELQWLVECLLAWEIEGAPDEPPPVF